MRSDYLESRFEGGSKGARGRLVGGERLETLYSCRLLARLVALIDHPEEGRFFKSVFP